MIRRILASQIGQDEYNKIRSGYVLATTKRFNRP